MPGRGGLDGAQAGERNFSDCTEVVRRPTTMRTSHLPYGAVSRRSSLGIWFEGH